MGPQARFRKYELMVHPYSGLDPGNWKLFLNNLRKFEQLASSRLDEATVALYAAIENLLDMSLSLRRADDSEICEKLGGIARELGYEGETLLNTSALSQGLYFFPKYLNDSVVNYADNVESNPGPVKSHGQ